MNEQEQSEAIKALALTSPIVYQCLTHFSIGNVTYEQSLSMMVIALAEQNERLMNQLTDCLSRSAGPVVIIKK